MNESLKLERMLWQSYIKELHLILLRSTNRWYIQTKHTTNSPKLIIAQNTKQIYKLININNKHPISTSVARTPKILNQQTRFNFAIGAPLGLAF